MKGFKGSSVQPKRQEIITPALHRQTANRPRHNPRYRYGPFYSPREAELIAFYTLKEGAVLHRAEARRRIRRKRLKEMHEPYVSGREAAFVLGISPAELYRLVASGRLPVERGRDPLGRPYLKIRSADVRALATL